MYDQRLLFLALLVFTSTSDVLSQVAPIPKAVIIHRTYFQWDQRASQKQTVLFKARAQVDGLKSRQVKTTVLIRNADGSQLNGRNMLPTGWTNAGNGIENVWSGTIQFDQTGWDLKTPLPSSDFFSTSAPSMNLIFRYTIECDGMKSTMESEIPFPFTSINCTRSLQFEQVNGRQVIKTHPQPDVAGMGVDEPNITVRDQLEEFTIQFSAAGMKDERVFVGVVFRKPSGEIVTPARACPQSNYGQNGQVQFQASEKILYDQASWKHFMLNVPVQWMDIDGTNDSHLIATFYISAGGLLSVHDREYTITGMAPAQEESPRFSFLPEEPATPALSQTAMLFKAVNFGDTEGMIHAIQQGADVRAKNILNQTPLHVAAALGDESASKILILADLKRTDLENGNTSNPSNSCPTLFMEDTEGNTPAQLAQSKGHPALAKSLMNSREKQESRNYTDGTGVNQPPGRSRSGSSMSNSSYRDDSSNSMRTQDISRYTQPLEQILAQVIEIKEQLIQLKMSGNPSVQDVYTRGTALLQVGKRLMTLFTEGGEQNLTRFGTLNEVVLVQRIRENHEKAGILFKELAGVSLPEASPATRRSRHRSVLDKVGKELIDNYATGFIQKKGLGDLLTEKGLNLIRVNVRHHLELDLKGFLDQKAIDLFGMPMGGLRSIKAAFRLQARHRIQVLAGELILNFTGNRLAIFLLKKIVLNLLENKLWPLLREGFRPKTKLARRVDISSNSMMNMCDELNHLAGTGNPQLIHIQDISHALDRAKGTIAAAKYLKKDLARSGSQDMKDTLAAAENILNRTMRRIGHQFLMLDSGKWRELEDQVNYIIGIHRELEKLLGMMNFTSCKVEIANPIATDMVPGRHYTMGVYSLPFIQINITELSPEIARGLKTLTVRVNNRPLTLYAILSPGRTWMNFKGCIPMFPGANEVIITSKDIAGLPETRKSYSFGIPYEKNTMNRLAASLKLLPGVEKALREAGDYERSRFTLGAAHQHTMASKYACQCHKFSLMNQLHSRALQLINQSQRASESQNDLADIHSQKACSALFAFNISEYQSQINAELQARQGFVQYLKNKGNFTANRLIPIYETCFDTADMLLVLGFEPEQVKPLVMTGLHNMSLRQPGRGDEIFTASEARNYPNLAAIFFGL
jgi:hypothetical protein